MALFMRDKNRIALPYASPKLFLKGHGQQQNANPYSQAPAYASYGGYGGYGYGGGATGAVAGSAAAQQQYWNYYQQYYNNPQLVHQHWQRYMHVLSSLSFRRLSAHVCELEINILF